MIDAKKAAEADQALTALSEMLPPLWYQLYNNCCKEGFTEQQAFTAVLTYIKASIGISHSD